MWKMQNDSECVFEHQENEPVCIVGQICSDFYPNKRFLVAARQCDPRHPRTMNEVEERCFCVLSQDAHHREAIRRAAELFWA